MRMSTPIPEEVKDIKLNIHIDHKRPMELMKLTETLVSISKEYEAYALENGFTPEDRQARLYVKEIKSGSTIVDLVEFASAAAIPFTENVNTIVGFAQLLKTSYDWILNKDSKEKPNISDKSLKNLSKIIDPVASDSSAQLNISSVVNGNVEVNVFLDSNDANAVQNLIQKELIDRNRPDKTEVLERVLMTLYQARGDVASKVGNSALVADFDSQPHRVRFASTELKEEIVKGDENPFNYAYVVDVKPEYVTKNKVIYFVLDLHESISLNEL